MRSSQKLTQFQLFQWLCSLLHQWMGEWTLLNCFCALFHADHNVMHHHFLISAGKLSRLLCLKPYSCIWALSAFKYAASHIMFLHHWLRHCHCKLHVMYLCCTQDSNVCQFNELRRNILQVSHVPCVLVSLSNAQFYCMHVLCVLCVLWVLQS